VTLLIGRSFSRGKPYWLIVSVEIKSELIKHHNVMARVALLLLKDLQECLRISGSIMLLLVYHGIEDPTKRAEGEAQ
jgi:hypothetical protein